MAQQDFETVGDGDSGITQDMYADDFFSGDQSYVSQDGGDYEPPPQQQPAPQPVQQQPNPQQGQIPTNNTIPGQQPQQPLPSQEGVPDPAQQVPVQGDPNNPQPPEPNPFDFQVTGENGETSFDANSAFKAIFPNDNVLKPVVQPQFQQPIPGQQPPAQQPEAPKPDYRETLESNMRSYHTIFKGYIDQGYDTQVAETLADKDFNTFVNNHMQEKGRSDYEKSFEDKFNTQMSKLETTKLEPTSTQNINNITFQNGWGSSRQLEQAIMHPEIGADLFLSMHKMANPDQTYASQEEYSASLKDYYVKATSNPEQLAVMEKFARAMIFMRNKDSFQGHAGKNQQSQQSHNTKVAQRSGGYTRRTGHRQPANRQPAQGSVDQWINNFNK